MRIIRIELINFRCLRNVSLPCSPLTALLGANGSGKSSVITALEFFFLGRDVDDLDCSGGGIEPISVAVTLAELPPDRHERLRPWLDDLGQLRLERIAEPRGDGRRTSRFQSVRRQVPEFRAVRQQVGAPALRAAYSRLRAEPQFAGLPAAQSQTAAKGAMDEWERAHPEQCEPAPDDTLTIGGGGAHDLAGLFEFVVVPAVRDAAVDAAEGRTGGLRQLIDLLIRTRLDVGHDLEALRQEVDARYQAIIRVNGDRVLHDTSTILSERLAALAPGSSVRLCWEPHSLTLEPPRVRAEIVEAGFPAEVGRQGHGVQRAYVLALLQALVEARSAKQDAARPLLVLALEEPELYQHPVRARYLAGVLRRLATDAVGPPTQVLYTTHSPFFVSVDSVESIRLLRVADGDSGFPESVASQVDLDAAAQELWAAHGAQGTRWTASSLRPRLRPMVETPVSEGFFAAAVVLVEGEEDRALLAASAAQQGLDLSQRGIAIIPVAGKANLDRAVVLYRQLGVPTYVLFDADRRRGRNGNPKANRALLALVGHTPEDFPATQVQSTFACFTDTLLDAVRDELGDAVDRCLDQTCADFGFADDRWKNSVVLAQALDVLAQQGRTSATLLAVLGQVVALIAPTDPSAAHSSLPRAVDAPVTVHAETAS